MLMYGRRLVLSGHKRTYSNVSEERARSELHAEALRTRTCQLRPRQEPDTIGRCSQPRRVFHLWGGGETVITVEKWFNHAERQSKHITRGLTDCKGVIDFEVAEHLVDVSGMEEAISTHHHLKSLWLQNTQTILHLLFYSQTRTRFIPSYQTEYPFPHKDSIWAQICTTSVTSLQ